MYIECCLFFLAVEHEQQTAFRKVHWIWILVGGFVGIGAKFLEKSADSILRMTIRGLWKKPILRPQKLEKLWIYCWAIRRQTFTLPHDEYFRLFLQKKPLNGSYIAILIRKHPQMHKFSLTCKSHSLKSNRFLNRKKCKFTKTPFFLSSLKTKKISI